MVQAAGSASTQSSGPADANRHFVQTVVQEHAARVESIAASASSVAASRGCLSGKEAELLRRAPELQQLGTWLLTLGEDSELEENGSSQEA